jgi:hypothetical protein
MMIGNEHFDGKGLQRVKLRAGDGKALEQVDCSHDGFPVEKYGIISKAARAGAVMAVAKRCEQFAESCH